MDDTAEIRERLGRISSLAEAGATGSELLHEVRGLLEEGERALRRDGPAAGAVESAAETPRRPRTSEGARAKAVSSRSGKKATVA